MRDKFWTSIIWIILVWISFIWGEKNYSLLEQNLPDTSYGPEWVGWTILATEYIAGPIFASQYWWKHGFAKNPFKNINEQENYVEDKIWHFWNGENITDLHYWTLKKYFGRDDPWLAMGMTFATLTGVELFDASDKEGKWGLSLWDGLSNVGGILFWYAKYKSPREIPIDVRIGIRRWDRAYLLLERATRFRQDFHSDEPNPAECCPSYHYDNYSIFKTEVIIRPYSYFYFGGAASLPVDENDCGVPGNLFGITVGFDFIRYFAKKYPTRFSPFLNTFGKYCSASIAYTYWFE
ncbi:hypothetical protein DRQ33_05215 [bacterium]|nr:MAG: hypothetical protein DRQ33_05215 [bacterium]